MLGIGAQLCLLHVEELLVFIVDRLVGAKDGLPSGSAEDTAEEGTDPEYPVNTSNRGGSKKFGLHEKN